MKTDVLKNKTTLNLLKNPYEIEYSRRVVKTIDVAMNKGFISLYNINPKIIKDYKHKKKLLPLWVLEAACKINNSYHEIPIDYQNIWFCLHDTILTRMQPSGRRFRTKVNFTSCYTRFDKRLKELLANACNKANISLTKFSVLCGYKDGTIRRNSNIISLKAVLKICQLIESDIWDILENYELFGKTNRLGKIKIPRNEWNIEIETLIVWLRTEGHIELGNTHIEINQKDNLTSLTKLKQIIIDSFDLRENNTYFCVGKRGEDRLILSSSPLRQLLCLKYGFPLGYKTGSLIKRSLDNLSDESYRKLMAAFIETEGCLSYHYTRGKKRRLPKFEFVVKDKALINDCSLVLSKMGFTPNISQKQNIFKIGLYNHKDVVELVHQTESDMLSKKRVINLRNVCTNGIGL